MIADDLYPNFRDYMGLLVWIQYRRTAHFIRAWTRLPSAKVIALHFLNIWASNLLSPSKFFNFFTAIFGLEQQQQRLYLTDLTFLRKSFTLTAIHGFFDMAAMCTERSESSVYVVSVSQRRWQEQALKRMLLKFMYHLSKKNPLLMPNRVGECIWVRFDGSAPILHNLVLLFTFTVHRFCDSFASLFLPQGS